MRSRNEKAMELSLVLHYFAEDVCRQHESPTAALTVTLAPG